MPIETLAIWVAIAATVVATVATTVGLVFGRDRALAAADVAIGAAAVALGAMLGVRWFETGHGPALGFFEVAALLGLITLVLLLVLQRLVPGLRVAGLFLLPVALLVLGGTLFADSSAESVSGSLASGWLVVHVVFANLSYGCYVAAFALSAAFLLHASGRVDRFSAVLSRLPERDELDALTIKFVGAGFLFQSVMIVSGAIWANEAWGRYWAWDPTETWSLVVWVIYALYLHLTLTLGWRGRRAAWIAVLALPVSLFSALGVPLVYQSIHGAYLSL